MAEFEGIQFQIVGETKKASDSIDKLIDKLNALKQSTSKLRLSFMSKNTIDNLDRFRSIMTRVNTRHISTIANNLERIAKIDFSNLNQVASDMNKIFSAASKATGKKATASKGAKDTAKTSETSEQQQQTAAVEATISKTKSLYDTIMKANSAWSGMRQNVDKFAENAKQKFGEFAKTAGERIADVKGKFDTFADNQFARSVSNITERMGSAFKYAAATIIQPFAFATKKISDLFSKSGEESSKNFSEKFSSSKKFFSDFSKNIGGKFVKSLKNAGKAYLNFSKNLIKIPFKSFSDKIKNTTKSVLGFVRSLKRIMMYRAVRAILAGISKAISEGIQNIYQYSLIIDTKFHKSMDSIATSALYLKNSIGSIAAPILNVVAPAFEYLADKIASVMNLFAQFIATISGNTQYTKAVRSATKYADAVEDASKEAKSFMLGFDELNVFDPTQASGGKEIADYASMFEEATVDDEIKSLWDRIKEAFEVGDFSEFGASVGTNIENALDNINWEGIKDKATKIGSSIGTFINGAIGTEDFGKSIGENIANALNTGINFLSSLYSSIEWNTLGSFVAESINGVLNTFDFKKAGLTFNSFINGILDASIEAVKGVEWDTLGNKIGEFIAAIEWGKIFGNIITLGGNLVKEILTAAVSATEKLKEEGTWIEIGTKIGEALRDVEWGKIFKNVAKLGFNIISGLFETIVAGVSAFIGKAEFDNDTLNKIADVLATAVMAVGAFTIFSKVWQKISGLFGGSKGNNQNANDGGFKVPSVQNVLTGMADIAIIIGGTVGIVEAVGALISIPYFDTFLETGIKSIQDTFTGLSDIALEIIGSSAVITILGKINVSTVALGLANFAIIVDGVPIVITALGALLSIPYLSDFLDTGIEAIQKTFKGLGSVAKELGITGAVILGLGIMSNPAVTLSGLTSFTEIIAGVTAVIAALGKIFETDEAKAILDEGDKSLSKIGEIIGNFGGSIIKGFLEKSSDALPTIGENLAKFAENSKPFFDIVSNLGDNILENTTNMLLAVSKFADNIPTSGGLWQYITGEKDVEVFGKQLVSFGQSFADYAEKVKNIDYDIVTKSLNIADTMTTLAEKVPTTGGLVSWFTGEKSISSFGEEIALFGGSFKTYYENIKDINNETTSTVTTLITDLINVLNTGIELDTKKIKNFGNALESFGKNLSGTEWQKVSDDFTTGLTTMFTELETKSTDFKTTMDTLQTNLKTTWSTINSDISSEWDSIEKTLLQKVSSIVSGTSKLLNKLIRWVNKNLKFDFPGLDIDGETIIKPFKFQLFTLPEIPDIAKMADGGFVDRGQMFIAREAGAEMVGAIGKRTAVANNDQIVEGIAEGVTAANYDVVQAIEVLTQVLQNKDMVVNVGDEDIGRSYDRYKNNRGLNVNRGAFANSY